MRRSLFTLALVLALTGVACSKAKDTGFPPIPTGTATETKCEADTNTDPQEVSDPILVGDNFYAPLQGEVKAGTEIHWEQCGTAPHSVTFSTLEIDSHPDCKQDVSKCMADADEYSTTLSQAGKFHYYCVIHGVANSDTGMYGYINVT